MSTDARTWWVVCHEWVAGPYYRRGAADAKVTNVVELGDCKETHEVVESFIRPVSGREKEIRGAHDADQDWAFL